MPLTVSSEPFQVPLAPETFAELVTPAPALSPLGTAGFHCQVVATPHFSGSGKSSKDRVHISIYDVGALEPSNQVTSPVSCDGVDGRTGTLPLGALLVEFTFHGPAGLGGTHDSVRLGPASPAAMRKNGRAVPLTFKESVLFANRMYNWVYAQAQGLPGVSMPWAPLAETLDHDAIFKQTSQEVHRSDRAKVKDVLLSLVGLRS
ncbi:hypothetical protein BCR44DRAFT_42489 [Catenaria anguillulae PL171]|uniref:Uncharacterized protein n=1 Tax=Catenaria anguillulae PL171 TaxID=765915 RepID=A0A1Y2HVF3_9FUNG|nr:hypothetical protein BCR44DRAFT_42489 [Catenaria anguillulae PL171]